MNTNSSCLTVVTDALVMHTYNVCLIMEKQETHQSAELLDWNNYENIIYEPGHRIFYKIVCTLCEDSEQSAHLWRLISPHSA